MALVIEAQRAALDDLLITEELARRPAQAPDLAAENEALHALARLLIEQPSSLPKRLAELALDLCQAGSAGVSLLEDTPEGTVFRWTALAGQVASHVGGSTPRGFSPCGTCLDRGEAILLAYPARRFEYFNDVGIPVVEGLVVPLYGASKRPLGTIWIMSHSAERHFDREDLRVMTRLADFTALALEHAASNAAVQTSGQHLRENEERLSAELAAARQLQGISVELIHEQGADALYQKLVDAAALIMRADCASMQMLYPERGERGELLLLAFRGFDPEAAKFWKWVRADSGCTCGQALRTGRRAVASDVETCDFMAGTADRTAYLQAGMRAAQSTPLFSRSGRLVGMISTHWHAPHEPMEHELRLLDVLARQAADLIERARAEAAVRESDARFRALAKASSNVIYSMSADWSEMRQLEGRDFIADTDEPSRNWLQKYIHPDDQPHVMQAITEAVRTKSVFELEHRVRRVGGSLGWTLSRAVPLLDEDGNIVEWFGAASDVTARKEAEALTECQKQALELAIQNTPLNEALEMLVRTVEAQSTAGMLASILLLERDGGHLRQGASPNLPQAYNEAIDGIAIGPSAGSCGTAAYRNEPVYVSDIDTDPLWRDFRGLALSHGLRACWSTPIRSGEGKVLGTFAMYYREPRTPTPADLELVDLVTRSASLIIEHTRAEAKTRESEERYRATFEQAAAGIAHAALDGHWIAVNDRLSAITGYTREELLHLKFQDITHPDDLSADLAQMRALVAGEINTFSMDKRYIRKDRSIVWVRITVSLLRDECGAPKHFIAVIEDVSQVKAAEAALHGLTETLERKVEERTRALEAEMAERRKTERALQQAQRLEAVGQLTGGVAHDFNNLLTAVIGQAEGIIRIADGNERIVRMANGALRAAERGARLTAQLLAFARRQMLRPATMVVDQLMANIDDLVRRAVGEAIEVEFRAASDLWPTLVDPAQCESALLNLVINARDAMPEGGRLTIEARNVAVAGGEAAQLDVPPGDYVVVSVADTGTGMPPHVREHAFEPFFTTKDEGKGTGLGLAQIYGFAKQSGGAVTIESTMGHGTTVSLYLPRAETQALDGASGASEPARFDGQGKTVLVVEDQSEVREVIELALTELGYRILMAADGVEARKVLESNEVIDLLLTDIVMPNGVSGVALATAARQLRQDLKIVLMSGYPRNEIRGGNVPEEFVFLEKPFRQAELAATIAAAVKG